MQAVQQMEKMIRPMQPFVEPFAQPFARPFRHHRNRITYPLAWPQFSYWPMFWQPVSVSPTLQAIFVLSFVAIFVLSLLNITIKTNFALPIFIVIAIVIGSIFGALIFESIRSFF